MVDSNFEGIPVGIYTVEGTLSIEQDFDYSIWQCSWTASTTGQLNLGELAWAWQSEMAIVRTNEENNVGIQDMYTYNLKKKKLRIDFDSTVYDIRIEDMPVNKGM